MIGTPFSATAKRVMLLGAGELGKEVVIELQRFGIEVIAVDRYENAPAMQVADRAYVVQMTEAEALREVIAKENPHIVVPEVEAIATDVLLEVEAQGKQVVPSAKAVHITMNRAAIRKLAAEALSLATSPFKVVESWQQCLQALETIGYPCVIKPVMSSSGKGQSIVRSESELKAAWDYALSGGRTAADVIIVEGFIDFDFEITLLTVSHRDGISFCPPIGHRQEEGDYRESWQPQALTETVERKAQQLAKSIVTELGGYGLFGVELFIKGDEVYFNEVSPRPHDTGMVTLISQNLSEFSLHVRALLGLPIAEITLKQPSASAALLVEGESSQVVFSHLDQALAVPESDLKLFGKPGVSGRRRMGVALAQGANIEEACERACLVRDRVNVIL
ncbi:formate-dependent phosphoribosylglycinamide formyltransferase [Piscirickettsia litoralis]|uniref:Formate-dependent phosphoribosylglycinamide formyltransferase n=1 Tax=Piscirickettsia litoralis TaxID=1891921 RepID=A0ABX2ZZZ7_9GAMM|nr:formate-dependent phosphoribosylglycinamide formyltransferase [Piscirickettsia litoralis]ODN42196.1 phosphoribosylglycinamide formyltransferase 2 [Piscirickettsia litoralis]